ncbi:MAG: gamma-glutamylcyclotransferase family protein [Nanoarchaeota archaeon]|nr:gamma-glutamylcyclotransferase family protein [Nanoarchaeota archaeon]
MSDNDQNNVKYHVVGYGSLMSHKSLQGTIPDRDFKQVIIKGYQRIFNVMAEKGKSPNTVNLIQKKGYACNGVLFTVNEEDLAKIKERESPEYELQKTAVFDFTSGKKMGSAFIAIDHTINIDIFNQKPNKSYFILCREAAYHLSETFGRYWDQTTYTSSGEKITTWLQKNKSYDTISKKSIQSRLAAFLKQRIFRIP